MEDPEIHRMIEQLVAEEHELWNRESDREASEADRRRLKELAGKALSKCAGTAQPRPRLPAS